MQICKGPQEAADDQMVAGHWDDVTVQRNYKL